MLHKSVEGQTSLFPGRTYPTGSVTGMPKAVQRLHGMDPPGYLLDKGTYRHLNLPAFAEENEAISIGRDRVHRRRRGDLLFPSRLNHETLDRMRREMGAATFNCQYQQNPIAPDGSPLQWEWFKTYDQILDRRWY